MTDGQNYDSQDRASIAVSRGKNQHSAVRTGHVYGVSLCRGVIHKRAQESSDNFPSDPPYNYHSSDAVDWREEEVTAVY